jgi:CBS domain-containing protein
MTRTDVHLDAMLRHLGAAYYDSLHGRADDADVRRALAQIATEISEKPGDGERTAGQGYPHGPGQHGRQHSRVQDIMTTSVVSVDRITPYKEIAALLAEHRIGGMPVLKLGRHVAGMVTDADLVAAAGSRPGGSSGWLTRRRAHPALTAEQLMTSPAITTYPDAPLASVARTLTDHRIRRLPVVNSDGVLVGIVSRRDLLRVFLRPDADIARQVSELLTQTLPASQLTMTAAVRCGIVTLSGQAHPADKGEL